MDTERIDLSVSHLSKIECGKKPVYLDKLAAWRDVLGVPIGQIVTDASVPEAMDIAARCLGAISHKLKKGALPQSSLYFFA